MSWWSMWTVGPKYIAYPDWLDKRTEGEAKEIAKRWLSESGWHNFVGRDALLILRGCSQGDPCFFAANPHDYSSEYVPSFTTSWLAERYASVSVLTALIEDLRPLVEGEYWECVRTALWHRGRVEEQIKGTYRELTLGGWRKPRDFPRYEVMADSPVSAGAYIHGPAGPPYQTPRFSHYWLDGEDKDLFAIGVSYDPTSISYLSLTAVRLLSTGEYSVHVSQVHSSLPCDEAYLSVGGWWTWDTTEWVVKVTSSQGE